MEPKPEQQVHADQADDQLNTKTEKATTFTLFAKLSVELRLMIWYRVFPQREYMEVSLAVFTHTR
jgi:hypothetical protein